MIISQPNNLFHFYEPTFKLLELPKAVQELEEPPISWKSLTAVIENKPQFQQGLQDLFDRIESRRQGPSAGGESFYLRLEKYVGHLLHYADSHPEDADTIYAILSELNGRCGGIMEEVELNYLNYCKSQKQEDLQVTIQQLAWQWRQSRTSAYISEKISDVHAAYGFRKALALMIGILPPQEEDRLGDRFDRNEVRSFSQMILQELPLQLINILQEQLQIEPDNKDQVRLKVGEGGVFADLLIEDMLAHGCFEPSLIDALNQQLKQLKEDIQDEAKLELWLEKLNYVYDKEDIEQLNDDSAQVFALGQKEFDRGTLALRHAILYPACRQHLQKQIAPYLEKMGWLSKE